jgi:DHA2 family methylenomycin A resistance protein-like MFS transporter
MLLALLCVGIFLVQLDVTVVNVALPTIRTGLDTSLAGQQWVVAAYMITLAGLLLICGALGDRIGHKRVVLAGLTVFGIASLGCGMAPTIELLVAARAVQGIGAALLLPGTLAVITDLYDDSAARARAVGIWAGAGALALPSGPLLDARSRLRIGADFIGANFVAGLMNFVGLGTVLVLTLYLQEHLAHKAFRAGLELAPLFLPLAVLGPVSGRITARYGPRLPMTIGLALGALGSASLLGVRDHSGYEAVVPVELGLGLGMGFLTAAVVNAAVASLPGDRAGLASGVNNTCRQAVGALGVVVYGAAVAPGMVSGLHTLAWLGSGLWALGLATTWLTVS